MALEYESNPNLVGAIKAPLGVLGSDKNYRQVLYETIAEQVEGLGRRPNANYNVGDVVYPSSNLKYALICTTAGTSGATDLDISANTEGDTITDGTVVWKVVKRNYLGSDGVLPIANGGTGANNASEACANLGAVRTVNGKEPDAGGNVNVEEYTHPNSGVSAGTYTSVTVNAQGHVTSGSNPVNAYVVSSGNSNGNWYRKWSDGFIEQGGSVTAYGTSTITFPIAFATTDYYFFANYRNTTDSSNIEIRNMGPINPKTTSCQIRISNSTTFTRHWYACGY